MANKQTSSEASVDAGELALDEEMKTKSAKSKREKVDLSAGPTPEFANVQDLMKAISTQRNLVEVGSSLLGSTETKGASVRARMFETTLEYLYGKPAAAPPPQELPVRVVWDIPMDPPDEPKK
jgi:hypothetical protein